MTTDLVTWLRQQLDEDEELAGDAAGPGDCRRRWMREGISCVVDATDNGLIVYGEGTPTPEQADHIVRWDPARVLAEVDAKRRVVDAYVDAVRMHRLMRETDDDAKWDWLFKSEALEVVVQLLALPYADCPGYRQEWAP